MKSSTSPCCVAAGAGAGAGAGAETETQEGDEVGTGSGAGTGIGTGAAPVPDTPLWTCPGCGEPIVNAQYPATVQLSCVQFYGLACLEQPLGLKFA